jgi:hypothetical protein
MNVLLLLLLIVIVAALLWFWWQRREHPGEIEAADVAIEVRPTKVMLPDEDGEPEEQPARRRTGETQELRREVVHGPYRAIDDRGAPSEVQMPRQS